MEIMQWSVRYKIPNIRLLLQNLMNVGELRRRKFVNYLFLFPKGASQSLGVGDDKWLSTRTSRCGFHLPQMS